MKNILRTIMMSTALCAVIGCAGTIFAQASAAPKADDKALNNQTVRNITATNALYADREKSFSKTRDQQKAAAHPDNKIVCASLAEWKMTYHDRIANLNDMRRMLDQHIFDAHRTAIEKLRDAEDKDLGEKQFKFAEIASSYGCGVLSHKTSSGSDSILLSLADDFDYFAKTTDAKALQTSKDEVAAAFKEFIAQFDAEDAKIYADVKAAIEKYEKSIKGDDTSGGSQYQIPDPNAKHINPLDDILAKCNLLIQHNAKMPDYYRLRGKARYYRAIDSTPYMFTESLSLNDPNFAAKYSPLDIAAGIKDLSDALSINPAAKLDGTDAAEVHLFRGKLYVISASKNYSKQNLQNALVDFDDAVKLDGYVPPPDEQRKAVYLLSKDGDLVGQDFASRIKADPSNAKYLYLERADYLSTIVEYTKGLADLLRYANAPGNDSATDKQIIGLKYAILNKLAADAYKKTNLNSAEDYLEKAQLEVQFPKNEEAASSDATEAIKRNSLSPAAHVIRAKVLIDKGQVDESIAEANLALTQDADNVGALCIRGLGFAIKNDIRTLDDLNRAIALDPELAFLYNAFGNRARIYTALGKADLAAADTQKSDQLAKKLAGVRQ